MCLHKNDIIFMVYLDNGTILANIDSAIDGVIAKIKKLYELIDK